MIINCENLGFQIMSVLNVSHPSGFFSVDNRPFSALSFRLSGRGTFKINGETLVSNAGDILYIPANATYEANYTQSEMIVVHMIGCNYNIPEVISPRNFLVVEQLFVEMQSAWKNKRSTNFIKSRLFALFDLLANDVEKSPLSVLYARCIEYINQNFCDPNLNVAMVCKNAYACRSTVQRAFKLNLGTSPSQYITKLRIEKALKMLSQGGMSVSEVSFLCGFSDEKYFSRVFKKTYGFSPSFVKKSMLG